jgi:hypothetical protein
VWIHLPSFSLAPDFYFCFLFPFCAACSRLPNSQCQLLTLCRGFNDTGAKVRADCNLSSVSMQALGPMYIPFHLVCVFVLFLLQSPKPKKCENQFQINVSWRSFLATTPSDSPVMLVDQRGEQPKAAMFYSNSITPKMCTYEGADVVTVPPCTYSNPKGLPSSSPALSLSSPFMAAVLQVPSSTFSTV